eukprot:scaffold59194_cov29-Phaeocystis_antarctica.AAC.1
MLSARGCSGSALASKTRLSAWCGRAAVWRCGSVAVWQRWRGSAWLCGRGAEGADRDVEGVEGAADAAGAEVAGARRHRGRACSWTEPNPTPTPTPNQVRACSCTER